VAIRRRKRKARSDVHALFCVWRYASLCCAFCVTYRHFGGGPGCSMRRCRRPVGQRAPVLCAVL